ncbi:MAG: glutamine-hydrolyzing carbamoyl-phosphate synthase small subunit [Selenomonadaceae bacterium]|nr:glutamine-hydrolyzing carbamoyl-phosphate synthase small subunit [Selenomonadaceae bacterium]
MKGKLILQDGTTFRGQLFGGSNATTEGEVVFNTGMTGYQEILTDPSYCHQIVTLTYPLIGNYGTAKQFNQSRKSFVGGLIVGELCEKPSSSSMQKTLAEFLTAEKIPCLYDVDTRALTRKIRSAGTMKGVIVSEYTSQGTIDEMMSLPIRKNVVEQVTTPVSYTLDGRAGAPYVVTMDFGIKRNILDAMRKLGCKVTVVPAKSPAEAVLTLNPDGIFLSNGPGDPKDVPDIIREVKKLIGQRPIFGICLGHQILALAMGANTYKLKFGHRGSNQPVKDLRTGKVAITSQNHGYAIDAKSLEGLPVQITHVSLNDGTIEGFRHTSLPISSVQYHPEAAPGPNDSVHLFDEFIFNMKKFKGA